MQNFAKFYTRNDETLATAIIPWTGNIWLWSAIPEKWPK